MVKFEKLHSLHKYSAAISFLALEIFALIAFSFGDSFILYGALSLAMMLLLILFNIKQITVDGISSVAFFIFPLFLFTLLCALGVFSTAHRIVGDFNIAELVFIPLGLVPVAFSGYILSVDKTFKIKTFLIVIYSALAVITLINIIVNLVNFGAFYTVIYRDYLMYYKGEASSVPVQDMAYTLQGLKFVEVKMSQYVINPALLLTSSVALLFTPIKEKKTFVLYIVFTLLGILALVLFPTLLGAITVIIVMFIDIVAYVCYRFKAARKPLFYVLIVVLLLIALVFIAFTLTYQDSFGWYQNIVNNNGLLTKLFISNRYAQKYSPAVDNILFTNFLGVWGKHTATGDVLYTLTGSFLFDNVMTSGVIGALAFIFMIVIGYKGFKKYFINDKEDQLSSKMLLIAFVSLFIIFSATLFEREFMVFHVAVRPIYMSGPFMIMLFIFTYVISRGNVKVEEKEEKVDEKEN